MSRFSFAISILVAVVAIVAFAACGGSDDSPLSEDEYFDRLEELKTLGDTREAAAGFAGDSPPEVHEAWEEWVLERQVTGSRTLVEAFSGYVQELEAIQPPDTLRDVHALYLSATKALSLALVDSLANLEQQGSLHEASDAVGRSVLAAGEQQFEACKALEDASGGRFSCLADGVCYSDVSRDTVVACSSEVTVGGVDCIGFLADIPDDVQQGDGDDCASGGSVIDIVPDMSGRLAEMPPLPDGYEALSGYIVFQVDSPSGSATFGLPLNRSVENATGLGWYTYENGEWRRLDVTVLLVQAGTTAEGDFAAIPPNLIVLRER